MKKRIKKKLRKRHGFRSYSNFYKSIIHPNVKIIEKDFSRWVDYMKYSADELNHPHNSKLNLKIITYTKGSD